MRTDGKEDISFTEAFDRTRRNISPLTSEHVELSRLTGRIAAEDVISLVDAPSADVSLKDGYAVRAGDVAHASDEQPVVLALIGTLFAGAARQLALGPGQSIKIMTGATLPLGAECVVAQEYGSDDGVQARLVKNAQQGQNVMAQGTDLRRGEIIIAQGTQLRPGQIGFIAAAGHSSIRAFKSPRVAVIATGDEVIAPGKPFEAGKVFASNLATIAAWCARYGMDVHTVVVKDNEADIGDAMLRSLDAADCVITSGGAWKSERDLTVKILDSLGWTELYHHVKMGPGKAIGFGMLRAKPVFCLPGGPPSNLIAFLQLALPGLLTLAGYRNVSLPTAKAVLEETVRGQRDWTQFIHGLLEHAGDSLLFHPLRIQSRLRMLAQAQAIVSIPEGRECIDKGSVVSVQLL